MGLRSSWTSLESRSGSERKGSPGMGVHGRRGGCGDGGGSGRAPRHRRTGLWTRLRRGGACTAAPHCRERRLSGELATGALIYLLGTPRGGKTKNMVGPVSDLRTEESRTGVPTRDIDIMNHGYHSQGGKILIMPVKNYSTSYIG